MNCFFSMDLELFVEILNLFRNLDVVSRLYQMTTFLRVFHLEARAKVHFLHKKSEKASNDSKDQIDHQLTVG